VDAEVFDIDLFDNDCSVSNELLGQRRKVIGYISAGSCENWQPDTDKFPSVILGNDYAGWPGKKWLDILSI
jgi:hypothetical protein